MTPTPSVWRSCHSSTTTGFERSAADDRPFDRPEHLRCELPFVDEHGAVQAREDGVRIVGDRLTFGRIVEPNRGVSPAQGGRRLP